MSDPWFSRGCLGLSDGMALSSGPGLKLNEHRDKIQRDTMTNKDVLP